MYQKRGICNRPHGEDRSVLLALRYINPFSCYTVLLTGRLNYSLLEENCVGSSMAGPEGNTLSWLRTWWINVFLSPLQRGLNLTFILFYLFL